MPKNIPCPYETLIDLDIKRTFPSDPFFKIKDNLDKVKRILLAYTKRSITIGYCQGFNYIVGKILKITNDEV